LGIGACGQDAVDPDELKFVYHRNGQDLIQVSQLIDLDLPVMCFVIKN
jgi:hypothetical protein